MIAIRKASSADAVLLSEMGYTSYLHHFAHLWQDPNELQDFLHQEYSLDALQVSLLTNDNTWFIAHDPEPIGFAKVTWHCQVIEAQPPGTLLHKLYFLPGKTGQGYGTKLLNEIEKMAKGRGETFFWLEVLGANAEAYQFYRRQGLELIKDTLFSSASQQSTVHILGKRL